MTVATHTYSHPGPAGAPYAALEEDARQGRVHFSDVVIFDWEQGRRNSVRSILVDAQGRVNLWLAEIAADEIAA